MQLLIRKSWFRLLIVVTGLLSLTAIYPYLDGERLRESVGSALRASTLLFAVCTALSLAVLNNYVKGLKEAATNRISDIRTMLEKLYDEFYKSEDSDIQEIINNYVTPLLAFSSSEWHAFDPIKPVLGSIVEPLSKLHGRNPSIAPRYFLRLEDEINELGLLYIRRVISGLHADTIAGAFALVSMGIISIFFIAILPSSFLLDFIALEAATAVAIFAVLELILLFSYIRQEAREELPETGDDQEVEE